MIMTEVYCIDCGIKFHVTLGSFDVRFCPSCGGDQIDTVRADAQQMIYKWVEEIGEDREFLRTVINTCEDSHTMTLKEMAVLC